MLKRSTQKEKLKIYKVEESSELMAWLQQTFPQKNRKAIKSLLSHRQVMVNNRVVTQFNHPLKSGQEIAINFGKVQQELNTDRIKIIYEDPYLVVIDKKPGLLSIPNPKEEQNTAISILVSSLRKNKMEEQVFIVNLLDKAVSGLMIFAKDKEVHNKLIGDLKSGNARLTYTAVAQGMMESDKGKTVSFLKENRNFKMYSSTDEKEAQKAITRYKVLNKNNRYTLLELVPETQVKNQIRVHMENLGHSIVGDVKYGATTRPIKRLGLHCGKYDFVHPLNGKKMTLKVNPPRIFSELFT